MPAINFKHQFAPAVELGRKRQTIRADRKDNRPPCKLGDTLSLYTALRTKAARRLGKGTCTFLGRIQITETGITVGDRPLTAEDQTRLAIDDGFASTEDLVAWFQATHGLPFTGWIIKWEPHHG